MPETKYLVNVEGQKIEVGAPDFYEKNQGLAIAYGVAPNQEKKGEIAYKLLTLCKPVFQAWKIFDSDDREDFEQECYLLTVMALESFNEKKGAFVTWLKKYAQGRRTKTIEKSYKRPESFDKVMERGDEDKIRPWTEREGEDKDLSIDLQRVKALVSPERFKLIKMRVIDGMTKEEIAEEMGISIPTLSKRLANAYLAIRNGFSMGSADGGASLMDDGSIWISAKKMRFIFDLTKQQLYKMSKEQYHTRWRINPAHITEMFRELRYRYKVGPKGVEYPEFIRRIPPEKHPFSKAAREKRKADGKQRSNKC